EPEQYDNHLYFCQQIELRYPGIYVHWFNISSPVNSGSNNGWGLAWKIGDPVSLGVAPRMLAVANFTSGTRVMSALKGTLSDVAQNAPNGTSLGFVTKSIYDAVLSLSNSLGGLFAINVSTGEVTVASSLAGLSVGPTSITGRQTNSRNGATLDTVLGFNVTSAAATTWATSNGANQPANQALSGRVLPARPALGAGAIFIRARETTISAKYQCELFTH